MRAAYRRRFGSAVAAAVGLATAYPVTAATAPDAVGYAPPASWVLPPPAATAMVAAPDAPLRVGYLDNQVRILADGSELTYTAYSLKILKPEALPAGNLTIAWQPDAGDLTVHHVRLVRDGKTIDVLASTKFTVLRRETQLEQSTLDGQRTATLQVPGLAVGDEIAFAVTIREREPAFGGRAAGLGQLPALGTPGAFRYRLLWPRDSALSVRASPDMPALAPVTLDAEKAVAVELRDPTGAIPTEGAPPRYNVRRLIEYSDFPAWADVSRTMAPLFDHAATLRAGSPIAAEAAAIAARTNDPAARTEAALQLVEDRIRYVYVGLDGGRYVPASADETWTRRYGDCKAKTVLLVAVLRALGIEAVPALVSSTGGDGMNERLPSPRTFDHVVVRATVAGRVEWLDGTRIGDRHLDALPLPWRWALPLKTAGAGLEQVAPRDVPFPTFISIVDIDARAGLDKDAKASLDTIVRGDEGIVIRTQLSALSREDAERALKTWWRNQADWLTPDTVSWSYDEKRTAVTLHAVGLGNPGWKGDAARGHTLYIPGAGFFAPDPMRRPQDQDQKAPWAVEFPRFRCWATTIHLPPPGDGFVWSLYAEPMDRRLGGAAYWRAAGFDGETARTVMSRHTYEPEASPEEARAVNAAIPGFNNNQSNISEQAPRDIGSPPSSRLPFDDEVDWLNAPRPCSP